MKARYLLVVTWVVAFGLGLSSHSLHAQGSGKAFSLVYSNNLNAEIDPCPT